MVNRLPWFERVFPTALPAHLLPVIVERLRGTPARLVDRLSGVPFEAILRRGAGTWSIQENVGHLLDHQRVEPQRGTAGWAVHRVPNGPRHDGSPPGDLSE